MGMDSNRNDTLEFIGMISCIIAPITLIAIILVNFLNLWFEVDELKRKIAKYAEERECERKSVVDKWRWLD